MRSIITTLSLFVALNVFSISEIDSLLNITKSDTSSVQSIVRAYNLLSGKYNTSSLDSSIMYAEKSFSLSSKHQYFSGMCKASFNKAIIFSNFQKREESIDNYKKALNYAEKAKDPELINMVMLNMGIEYSQTGNYREAINWLNQTKEIAQSNNDPEWELKALNSIGNVYMLLSDYSKAQVAFFEALEINKQLKNELYETIITNNIGNIYYYLSNHQKAIEYYYLSLEIAEKINHDYFIQTAYVNMGLIYKELKEYDAAINNIQLSIAYFLNRGDKKNASNAYNSLGLIYQDLALPDSALIFFKKALTIKKEIIDSTGMAMVYNNIGSAYIDKNMPKKAEKSLKIATKLCERYSDNYNKTMACFSLGELYLANNESKGLNYYQEAIDLSIKHNINEVTIQAYHMLYNYYKSKNNYLQSLSYFEKYTALNDSLHSIDSRLKIEDIETKYEVDKKNSEIKLLHKEQEIKDIIFQKQQEKDQSQRLLIILVSGLIILIVFIIAIWYRSKQRAKINQLEKRSLKVETQMLRSQMNPHFIFNSLNSIQSFISENDTIDAERYLSKFAQLMRLILDNSRLSYVTLENEINTLKLYLELERLRFDQRFDYHIEINDIDDEFTLVPPMLAQPYIENAILHGLSSKTDGSINIEYQQTGKKIICTIDDNGIGRKKSESLKKELSTKKASLGIKVTQERIELLSEEQNMDLNIKILDKYDNSGEALGTKVIIEMPSKE